MARIKEQVNVRLSDEARGYLFALQDYYGLSQAGIMEMLIRDKGREVGVSPRKGLAVHGEGKRAG